MTETERPSQGAGLPYPSVFLLFLIARRPSYGLQIIEDAKVLSDGAVRFTQGTLYPLLRHLEFEGLLRVEETEPLPERGGRRRNVYHLTDDGRTLAMRKAHSLQAFIAPLVAQGPKDMDWHLEPDELTL